MLDYSCIIKEDHLDIRKLSENVNIPLSKEDEKTLLQMHEYLVNGYDEEKAQKEKVRKNFDALMDRFLKNKVKYRVVKRGVKVTYKGELLCRMVLTGKRVIKVYLALSPLTLEDRFHAIDCTDKNSYNCVF